MLESRVAASDLGIVLSQQNQIKRLRALSRASLEAASSVQQAAAVGIEVEKGKAPP